MRHVQRVAEHRAQRRDAGSPGDEEEAPFGGLGRKREAADRTIDVDLLAGLKLRCGPAAPFGVDADQQLEVPVALAHLRAQTRSSRAFAARTRGSR